MTASFSWVDVAALAVSVASLIVTVAIFRLGGRLSFAQQRQRERELSAEAWRVLAPIRARNLSSKVILMNAARYDRDYDGSNDLDARGYVYVGHELIEIRHSGIEVIDTAVASYLDERGHRTLTPTAAPAGTVLVVGHVPWAWIQHIAPEGDEYDGSAIFFVRFRAPGRQPFSFRTYRDGMPTPFGPMNRDYYRQLPELGRRDPRFVQDWLRFLRTLRAERRTNARARPGCDNPSAEDGL